MNLKKYTFGIKSHHNKLFVSLFHPLPASGESLRLDTNLPPLAGARGWNISANLFKSLPINQRRAKSSLKKGILSLILIAFCFPLFSQVDRGTLLNNKTPASVDSFFLGNYLNLSFLRNTTGFLTNRDIKTYKGYTVPKRKKAFMRHVKHISEKLEAHYQDKTPKNEEILEMVYELFLLESSFKDKTIARAQSKIPFKEKVRLVLNSYRSKCVFTYKIPKETSPDFHEIPTSPYYHPVDPKRSLHKQFGFLADEKKVDPKKDMVVLFKELSLSGSAPKIGTMDLDLDNEWSLKWGDEVHTDVVGSRIFAALGFDIDHPYFYGENKLTLVFDEPEEVNNADELVERLQKIYKVNLRPFISNSGLVSQEMADKEKDLKPFIGKEYVRFVKCAIEARPDRVKRLGSFLPHAPLNQERAELKGALLAHHFIGNWDSKESNTLLSQVHMGKYRYRISGVFSDLGTSMGVSLKTLNGDFKVGLVNKFPWEVVKRKGQKLKFNNRMNDILPAYKNAEYKDLLWMAKKIGQLDSSMIRKIVLKAQWPTPIAELYFHKLASRRASILEAFQIKDPHPIAFNKKLTLYEEGELIVKEGILVKDYKPEMNPESFLHKKGRFRNYGN